MGSRTGLRAYDHIIIGAGSAGCALAGRLSEDPKNRVLLLEAGGPDKKPEVHIPAAFSKLFKGPSDWAYQTEPQAHLGGRRLYWPRGRMLGGCSSMNAMIYIRGHRRDFDRWRELGNDGWGFSDVLPFFKRAQHQERGPSELHGAGGPVNVADLRAVNPLSHAFVAAGVELGYPRSHDFNGKEQDGFGFYQVTQKGGSRCSAAGAYLRPALSRPNLEVATFAQATRLLFERRRAVGVEYVRDGEVCRAFAEQEILLSGGAVNSPQLLLLSGIGPAKQLRHLGIDVLVDSPGVGENLQDHLFVSVAYECTQPVSLASAEALSNVARYLLFKTGPLTSNVAEAGAFLRLDPALPAPDLQLHFAPAYYLQHGFTRPAGHGLTFGPTLIRPKSRGRISLRSATALDPPHIQPRYLESLDDAKTLVEGVELAHSLAHTIAFAPYRGGPLSPVGKSAAEMARFVRETAESIYHPVGTCKMGHDPMAVVDDRLRVHGVDGLRVVDASVMPEIVGGNPNAAILMIAERAADLVRGIGVVPDARMPVTVREPHVAVGA